ncbi:MAG TPA: winged helix-turn-helix domain-containing protein [Solirubrobacteraceae bacterium]|nr:winged helix-turn-helix domain-containing protein [Solirubrobacteraceae bacterium]
MPTSDEPDLFDPAGSHIITDAVAIELPIAELAEILRISAEIVVAERSHQRAHPAPHSPHPCSVPIDCPDVCHATYSPARDELWILMTPLFSARIAEHTPAAPVVPIDLSERAIAQLLTISSDQHPCFDTPNLAALITTALGTLKPDREHHIRSVLASPGACSIEYSPALDTLQIQLAPLHKLLVMAHLHDAGRLSARAIRAAVDLDETAVNSYIAALVDDGVLTAHTSYELCTYELRDV